MLTQTGEESKRVVSMEGSKAGTNKRSPDGLSQPNQNTILINIIVLYYNMWKKHNEIQLTKTKTGLNNRKMTNHPPFPELLYPFAP